MEPSSILKIQQLLRTKRQSQIPLFKFANHSQAIRNYRFSFNSELPHCRAPKHLPRLPVPLRDKDLNDVFVKPKFSVPISGGVWHPHNCLPLDTVAILVPYKNREENLEIFQHYMHSFLQLQGIEYALYVIEQNDDKKFNRAKLFNVGFVVSQMMHNYSCYILHDIDKLPENPNFIYRCSENPLRMTGKVRRSHYCDSAVNSFHKLKQYQSANFYKGFFGGVCSIRKSQIEAINGFPNNYWGWGAEDDDIYQRLTIKGFHPGFTKDSNSEFVTLYHNPDAVYNKKPMPRKSLVRRSMKTNGLTSLQFELVNIVYSELYTRIVVNL